MGEVATLWTGSAFECPHAYNRIVLLHNRFMYNETGYCNNGAFVARSVSVEGNYYTSQFSVIVTPEIAGKTIECFSDHGLWTQYIFSSVVPTIIGLLSFNIYSHSCNS